MTYQKPKVFFSRLCLSVSENNRGKCKYSQTPIKASELCVGLSVGGAKGEASTSQTCSLSGVAKFLKEVAQGSGIKLNPNSLGGFKSLSGVNQKQVAAMLADKGVSSKKKVPSGSKNLTMKKHLKK